MAMLTTARRVILMVVVIIGFHVNLVEAWANNHRRLPLQFPSFSTATLKKRVTVLLSTPFELNYYDDDDDDDDDENPYSSQAPLACDPDTKLVLGLNKYSHDTSLCAADAKTGQVLFAISKERLTRKKHDSGNVAGLVESCLDTLDLGYESIQRVVMNNHHHRILPLEENIAHLQWESGLGINGGAEGGYDDEENLFSDLPRVELSHHLAHAYSTACQAPFDKGMVVVMDGMGETYRTMIQAEQIKDPNYVSDFSFPTDYKFDIIPSDLATKSQTSRFDWREAESVYVFEKKKGPTIHLVPVFKRFTQENSPPTLYNHGFENMDSVGALYSRASSHIFGDWNACGKVMGLAPWHVASWKNDDAKKTIVPPNESRRVMWGTLYSEEENKAFQQDKNVIAGIPLIARMDSDLFNQDGELIRNQRYDFDDDQGSGNAKDEEKRLPTKVALEAIALANRVQVDLEEILMDFVKHFKEKTGEENLCISGGVALNSVLNGRLSRELGFANTYISPYPGDDGIAVGCCAYGLFGNEVLDKDRPAAMLPRPPLWKEPLPPYTGPSYTDADLKEAIAEAEPWIEVEAIRDEDTLLEFVAQEIQSGGVVAWYQGRSEMGPRALGHRSILADPRRKGLVRFINEKVKLRESFRPFAPSALVEHAADWFDLGDSSQDDNKSPYMSLTAMVKEDKRSQIPAVTHVDGSSRLQTVTRESEPLYHKLISRFFELTGVPMVLNTSFNTIPSEPIVETPKDAIRSFLCSMGSIEYLVMGDYVIKRKKPNLRALLGEGDRAGTYMLKDPAFPKRTGPATFQTTFEAEDGSMDEDSVVTVTKVRMPSRPMHNSKGEWFQVLDELEGELLSVCDGSNTLNDILAQYTAMDESAEMSKERMENTEVIVQNLVHRLVRLYEHTLISW